VAKDNRSGLWGVQERARKRWCERSKVRERAKRAFRVRAATTQPGAPPPTMTTSMTSARAMRRWLRRAEFRPLIACRQVPRTRRAKRPKWPRREHRLHATRTPRHGAGPPLARCGRREAAASTCASGRRPERDGIKDDAGYRSLRESGSARSSFRAMHGSRGGVQPRVRPKARSGLSGEPDPSGDQLMSASRAVSPERGSWARCRQAVAMAAPSTAGTC
jgi:hypothetical protein